MKYVLLVLILLTGCSENAKVAKVHAACLEVGGIFSVRDQLMEFPRVVYKGTCHFESK